MNISEWKKQLELEWQEKNRFFILHHQSTLPIEDNKKLKARLDYFPPDMIYQFGLEIHEYRDNNTFKMSYNRGNEKEFISWNEFKFKRCSKNCTLQAYKNDPDEDQLFALLPDDASGEEIFVASRYIDLESDRKRTDNEQGILDFNVTNNPWCAYSETYTYPFVPPENWLKIPIRTGKKKYSFKKNKEEGS